MRKKHQIGYRQCGNYRTKIVQIKEKTSVISKNVYYNLIVLKNFKFKGTSKEEYSRYRVVNNYI